MYNNNSNTTREIISIGENLILYKNQDGIEDSESIDWILNNYTKQKDTNTVTLYRYLYKDKDEDIIFLSDWTNSVDTDLYFHLLKTETKEIKYEL